MMLDPKILRENPEKIRKMLNDRGVDFDLDSLIRLDKERREFIAKTDQVRKKRNQISLDIGQKKKSSQDVTSLLDEMKNVSSDLEKLELSQKKIDSDFLTVSAFLGEILLRTT